MEIEGIVSEVGIEYMKGVILYQWDIDDLQSVEVKDKRTETNGADETLNAEDMGGI